MKPAFVIQVKIDGKALIAAGHPPFSTQPAGGGSWMVAGRDGGNCLAFVEDGLRAIFKDRDPAALLCQAINVMAPR